MDAQRVRLRHIRRQPDVSLTILDRESWYRHVTLRGQITQLLVDEEMKDIDRLSVRYLGVPYQKRDQDRITAWLSIDSWFGWDATAFREDGSAAPMSLWA